MPYRIMQNLIQNSTKTKEELLNMADIYYATGRLSKEQHVEIIKLINKEL